MMDETALGELLRIEREQLRWLRAMALPQVRITVRDALKSDTERLGYDLSDGVRTGRDVASATGVSPATVSAWWKKWRLMGIAEDADGRRVVHIATLAELGLESTGRQPAPVDAAGE